MKTPHRLADRTTWLFVAAYDCVFSEELIHDLNWPMVGLWLLIIVYLGKPVPFKSDWATNRNLEFGQAYNKQNRHNFEKLRIKWSEAPRISTLGSLLCSVFTGATDDVPKHYNALEEL